MGAVWPSEWILDVISDASLVLVFGDRGSVGVSAMRSVDDILVR